MPSSFPECHMLPPAVYKEERRLRGRARQSFFTSHMTTQQQQLYPMVKLQALESWHTGFRCDRTYQIDRRICRGAFLSAK